jgi:hypothetical protein
LELAGKNPMANKDWLALIKQANENPKEETDWKMWSNITAIGAIATLALFAGLVISGSAKTKNV